MVAQKKGLLVEESEETLQVKMHGTDYNPKEDARQYLECLGFGITNKTTLRTYTVEGKRRGGRARLEDEIPQNLNVAHPINGWSKSHLRVLVHEDDGPSTKEEKTKVWVQIGLEPTMQVWSGNKSVHSYWVLRNPVDPEVWQSLQKRLHKTLGGDGSLSDLGQMMRMPGFKHPKTGNYCKVERITNKQYLAEDFDMLEAIEDLSDGTKIIGKPLKEQEKEALQYLAREWGRYEPGEGTYPQRLRVAAILSNCPNGLTEWVKAFGDEGLGRKDAKELFESIGATERPARLASLVWEAKSLGWSPNKETNTLSLIESSDKASILSICETKSDGGLKLPLDTKAGKFLAEKWKERYQWCTEKDSLMEWDGSKWGHTETRLNELVDTELSEVSAPVGYLSQVSKYIREFGQHRIREEKKGTYFKNGVLRNGVLEDHDWSNYNQSTLSFDFDGLANCPKIIEWINWCQPTETGRNKLLALLACAAKGRPSRAQIFGEITGIGNSGKSTFTKLCQSLAGLENCVATDPNELEKERFGLYPIIGKKLVLLQDIGKYGGELNRLKALTGGDTLSAPVKYDKAPSTFTFDGLVLAVGEKTLRSSDYQAGLARRRVQINFSRQVEGRPRNLIDINKGCITGEFVEELPGLWNLIDQISEDQILEWLAAKPEEGETEEHLEQLAEQNPIAGFAMECLEPGEGSMKVGNNESATGLYLEYKNYCHRQAIPAVSVTRFGRDFKDVLVGILKWDTKKLKDSDGRMAYMGIQKKNPQ